MLMTKIKLTVVNLVGFVATLLWFVAFFFEWLFTTIKGGLRWTIINCERIGDESALEIKKDLFERESDKNYYTYIQ